MVITLLLVPGLVGSVCADATVDTSIIAQAAPALKKTSIVNNPMLDRIARINPTGCGAKPCLQTLNSIGSIKGESAPHS